MKQHLNLLPAKYQRLMLRRKRLRTWTVAWCTLLVCCSFFCGLLWFKVVAAQRGLAEAQRRAAGIQALDQKNSKLHRDATQLHEAIAKFGHLKNERLGIALLATVSESWSRCGGSIQVQKLTFRESQIVDTTVKPAPPTPGKPAKPLPTIKVQAVSITGVAAHNLAVSQFVSALRDSGSFQRVDLKSSKKSSDREATTSHVYQVECTL